MGKNVKIVKRGDYVYVFRPGVRKLTARNSAASLSIKKDRMTGATSYFKYLQPYRKPKKPIPYIEIATHGSGHGTLLLTKKELQRAKERRKRL